MPEARCPSMKRVVLHREGDREVYLRCVKPDNHDSLTHKSWMMKWKDDGEDGWFEDDYDD